MGYKDSAMEKAYHADWYQQNRPKKLAAVRAYVAGNKAASDARYKKWKQSPKGRFACHKKRAKRKGIPFLLTFSEWWAIWEASGKWNERGVTGYVMCRTGDKGGYEVGNVRIDTALNNVLERWGRL